MTNLGFRPGGHPASPRRPGTRKVTNNPATKKQLHCISLSSTARDSKKNPTPTPNWRYGRAKAPELQEARKAPRPHGSNMHQNPVALRQEHDLRRRKRQAHPKYPHSTVVRWRKCTRQWQEDESQPWMCPSRLREHDCELWKIQMDIPRPPETGRIASVLSALIRAPKRSHGGQSQTRHTCLLHALCVVNAKREQSKSPNTSSPERTGQTTRLKCAEKAQQ